jgi:hypothetical protein
MTVNHCHAAISASDTHGSLYVAATRGRRSNHIWVATDHPPMINGRRARPSAEQVLVSILTRPNLRAASAHSVATTETAATRLTEGSPELSAVPVRRR